MFSSASFCHPVNKDSAPDISNQAVFLKGTCCGNPSLSRHGNNLCQGKCLLLHDGQSYIEVENSHPKLTEIWRSLYDHLQQIFAFSSSKIHTVLY